MQPKYRSYTLTVRRKATTLSSAPYIDMVVDGGRRYKIYPGANIPIKLSEGIHNVGFSCYSRNRGVNINMDRDRRLDINWNLVLNRIIVKISD